MINMKCKPKRCYFNISIYHKEKGANLRHNRASKLRNISLGRITHHFVADHGKSFFLWVESKQTKKLKN